MKEKILKQRALAVQRYLSGENPQSICASLGKQNRGCTNGYHGIPLMTQHGVKASHSDRLPAPTVLLLRSKRSWRWFG